MTDLLYYTDAYLQEFDATITAAEEDRVALDDRLLPRRRRPTQRRGLVDGCRCAPACGKDQKRGRGHLALVGEC